MKIWLPTIRTGSGSDVFVMRLADGLQAAGHEAVIQWFGHRYELAPWLLRSIPAPHHTDIIHTGSWQGFAFKRENIPLVVTEHHYAPHPSLLPYKSNLQSLYHNYYISQFTKRTYALADAIVTVSDFCAKAMRQDLPYPVAVIHNWIDVSQFHPKIIPNANTSHPPFKLLFVGNPSKWKGADILPILATELGPDFEILCLGGLRKGWSNKPLPYNMRILPKTSPDKMPEVYLAANAALIPTRYETFGYVALEAMACGLPVIGFANSGTAEVCVHGETALLAETNNISQLAEYARRLAKDPSLCEQLGTAGRIRVLAHFAEEKAISSYLRIYEDLIDSRKIHG